MQSHSQTYITTTDLEEMIWELEGIWKYAALDYHIKAKYVINNRNRKANEYAITLMKLWDRLDGLSSTLIEQLIIELEGKIVVFKMPQDKREKKRQADLKALRTQLQDYLKAARE
jgi:hypothetical protein